MERNALKYPNWKPAGPKGQAEKEKQEKKPQEVLFEKQMVNMSMEK